MPPVRRHPSQHEPKRGRKGERVLQVLSDYCQGLQPGDIVPPHQELAQTFGASERSVRWALDELSRQGKIVRRQGARTQVAGAIPSVNGAPTLQAASAVPGAGTRTIVAIAIPDRALFDQAMQQLVEQAKMEEVSVFCHLVPESGGAIEPAALLPLLPHQPLGFILFRRELLPLAEQLQSEGHRVVLMATPYADTIPAVPVVYGNHKYGGYLVTKHLIELGHRNIGYCAYGDWLDTLRGQGHQRAMREAERRGLSVRDQFLDLESLKTDAAYADSVLTGPDAPTALTVWNDHEAVGVLSHLNRLGIRVPHDVSLVGYDNLPEGQMLHPPLTTVFSSMEQQLDAAIDLLTNPAVLPANQQFVIQPTLIQRGSSAPPPQGA